MPSTVEIATGKIIAYDASSRFYSVSTEDGRTLKRCRKVGDITTNTGARKANELAVDVQVIIIMFWNDDYTVDAPECFILGGFETFSGKKLGTQIDQEELVPGDQGFVDKFGRRLLLHPDGSIEVRSGAWCQFIMDPEDNSITGFFQNIKQQKDKGNFFKWVVHPKSDDLKDSIMHLCVSGAESLTKETSDIELLMGALYDLKFKRYYNSNLFDIDPEAKVAVRISNHDGNNNSDLFFQVGELSNGAVSRTKILSGNNIEVFAELGDINSGEIVKIDVKRNNGVEASFKIGDMQNETTGELTINNVSIKTFSDGRYQIMNDETEIEATNDGVVNVVCKESNLGEKDAENKLAIAEEVIDIFKQLFSAIKTSFYQTTAPGAPTKPGPLNQPQFDLVEQQLDKIKSQVHGIDK